jgi:hypothetical protein
VGLVGLGVSGLEQRGSLLSGLQTGAQRSSDDPGAQTNLVVVSAALVVSILLVVVGLVGLAQRGSLRSGLQTGAQRSSDDPGAQTNFVVVGLGVVSTIRNDEVVRCVVGLEQRGSLGESAHENSVVTSGGRYVAALVVGWPRVTAGARVLGARVRDGLVCVSVGLVCTSAGLVGLVRTSAGLVGTSAGLVGRVRDGLAVVGLTQRGSFSDPGLLHENLVVSRIVVGRAVD